MPSSNQALKTLLAQGKLEQALSTLVHLTEKRDDADLRQRILTLSGQFAALKKQHLTGLLEDKDYRREWNRIAAAVVDIVESEAVGSKAVTGSHRFTISGRWKKWVAILGIFAAVAGVTGYTLRDFLWYRTGPAPVVQPAIEPAKKDTLVLVIPPPDISIGKNNVNITVKGKAKGTNIITGDSSKIDIKQDF